MKKRLFGFALLILVFSIKMQGQLLSVKTNLLNWGLCAPNLSLELVTGERHSFVVSGSYMSKLYQKSFRGWMLMPEYRFWLSGRPMARTYLGVAAFGGNYNDQSALIQKGKNQEGSYAGVAATGGYSFYLGKRWNLELTAGVGVAMAHRRVYTSGEPKPESFEPLNFSVIPVNLGVTLGYIIK